MSAAEEEKWNLIYFYQKPQEAKDRMCRLIEDFYNEFFIHQLEKVNIAERKNINRMRLELSEGDYSKITKILTLDYKFIKDIKEVVFIPSYFREVGLTASQTSTENLLIIYGMASLDIALKEEEEIDIIEILKVISDEKRIKIIQLLNEGSYYGYEIGQKLNLSNSTISHHLSLLTQHQIINPIRLENKIYYEVDKNKIKEIFKKAEEALT